jgi:DNA-directed RNA polymerase specialized sigma24 family protein
VDSYGSDAATDSDTILPGGFSAADIAQEIVLKVLEGARRWDPEKHGDLLDYMIGQVRSLASHCLHSWAGKSEVGTADTEELTAEDYIDRVAASDARDDRIDLMSPEDIALDKDTRLARKLMFDLLLAASGDEPDLEAFVLAYVEKPDARRRLLAERLGKTPADVTNMVKRLRAKMYKALKNHESLGAN